MTTPIAPIGGITPLSGFSGPAATSALTGSGVGVALSGVTGTASAAGTAPAAGGSTVDFASALAHGLDEVAATQRTADQLAVQAATGQLVDPAQLTIAATKAQLMTQLATTIQSKAITAFNTVMSMQA